MRRAPRRHSLSALSRAVTPLADQGRAGYSGQSLPRGLLGSRPVLRLGTACQELLTGRAFEECAIVRGHVWLGGEEEFAETRAHGVDACAECQ